MSQQDTAQHNVLIQKFGDAKLIIKDDSQTNVLFVHKIVLASYSPYFDTMFKISQKEYTIKVPDALVMWDLIMSFYGINKESSGHPDFLSNINKARDFLCMPTMGDR